MKTARRPFALMLSASLLLSGCGAAPGALLATAPAAPVSVQAAAPAASFLTPSVSVTADAAPVREVVESTVTPVSDPTGIRIVGEEEISRSELKADAETSGYAVQAAISVPSVQGFVRRTEGTSYKLEATRNEFGESQNVTYALAVPDMATLLWLGQHVNRKVTIKGLFKPDHSVIVTFADKAIDLGFLTNWWTKGKLKGTVLTANGLPLRNVEVKARTTTGFVFLGNTDDVGAFALKNLSAGHYQLWFTKHGHAVKTRMVEIKPHKALVVEAIL